MELAIPYQLVGPDGTRIVFGNNDAAKNDADYVGFLDPDSGITGLLDGAEVRESASENVDGDGGTHGIFYRGRRPGTINIVLNPNAASAVPLETKIKRASRALDADATLLWTPSNSAVERRLLLRRQSRAAFAGRRPKTCQLAMVAADHVALSSTEHSATIAPGGAGGELGIVSPISSPLQTTFGSAGAQSVVNAGDEKAPWRAVLVGPLTNPIILNNTTAEKLGLIYTLGAGEALQIDSASGIISTGTYTGGVFTALAQRDALDFANSTWWRLPGSTTSDVRLLASAYSGGAQLVFYWRDAFE